MAIKLFTLNTKKRNYQKIAAGFDITVSGINSLMQALKDLGEEGYILAKTASRDSSQKLWRYVLDEAETAFNDSGRTNYGRDGGDGSKSAGKSNWNHQPGNLRRHILPKAPRKNKKKAQVYSTVGFSKGAAYGVPVEFGHKKVLWGRRTNETVKERSFIRVAFDKHKQELFNEMIATLWQGISRIWASKRDAA